MRKIFISVVTLAAVFICNTQQAFAEDAPHFVNDPDEIGIAVFEKDYCVRTDNYLNLKTDKFEFDLGADVLRFSFRGKSVNIADANTVEWRVGDVDEKYFIEVSPVTLNGKLTEGKFTGFITTDGKIYRLLVIFDDTDKLFVGEVCRD